MLKSERLRLQENKKKSVASYGDVSNKLILNYINKNNLFALKLMFYISKLDLKASSEGDELTTIDLSSKDLCSFCNITMRTLKYNLLKLLETSMNSINEEDLEEYVSLIPKLTFISGRNIVRIKMFNEVYELVKQSGKGNYTNIDLQNLMRVEFKHSVRILALLSNMSQYDNNYGKKKTLDLEDLNGFFGTNYKRINQIEQSIILNAKNDLDKCSYLSFKYHINYLESKSIGRPKAISITIELERTAIIKKINMNLKKENNV